MEVDVVEELGSDAYAYGELHLDGDGEVELDRPLIVRVNPRKPPAKGEVVKLRIDPSEQHVFSPESGLRVGS
jgi:multiple sugar transport system ATP-binding protein